MESTDEHIDFTDEEGVRRYIDKIKIERDLAIAHDTQPYPTAHAYEMVCKTEHKAKLRIDKLETALEAVEWGGQHSCCPACGCMSYYGHTSDCLVGQALKEYEKTVEMMCNPDDTLRGYPMYKDSNGDFRFTDTDELTKETWFNRPCGHCGEYGSEHDGLPDPCLRLLPGVVNACCGHGNPAESYIKFEGGVVVRGFIIEQTVEQYKEKVVDRES